MKKLLSPLSLAILALALIFSSVAYAKKGGNNPGDDNDGSTTLSLPFAAFGYFDAGVGCFDSDVWCESQYSDIILDVSASSDPGSFAAAGAGTYLACMASAGASASFGTMFMGEGRLDLTRHGLNGSMHHIEMFANFETIGGLSVYAGAYAGAEASGSSYVYTEAANWDYVCTIADYPLGMEYVVQDLCLYTDQYGFGQGDGYAYASAGADGWGDAYMQSASGVGTWTGVWAANIERFQSVVAAGASNFAFSSAGANASTMVEAFVENYMSQWDFACADLEDLNTGGFYSICSDGYSSAYAYAYQFAYDWISAYASAYAETSVGMRLPALYVNENGNVDTVLFGDGAQVWASGVASVSCGAGQ